jgi:diadenosine tetraphosphatase ApaH/serine/threonine PP2A family protein phosphatase
MLRVRLTPNPRPARDSSANLAAVDADRVAAHQRGLDVPTAVISDIHANAEALRQVLADIDRRGITRILCLGDIVGYGPEPLACVDMVRERCAWSLMGNHDFAVLYEPTNFNVEAQASAYWTREQFDRESDEALRASRYDFLHRLRVRIVEDGPEGGPTLLAVHGSPRRPINEYIFPEDTQSDPGKMQSIFDRIDRICIVGHTHVPGVFTSEPDFYPPGELGESGYKFLPNEKAVVNVGSVGQPRDGDPRASYAIVHSDRVEFLRVPYNVEATAKLLRAIPELPDRLSERLFTGR